MCTFLLNLIFLSSLVDCIFETGDNQIILSSSDMNLIFTFLISNYLFWLVLTYWVVSTYSTMAFILALAKFADPPLLALDEYDIFMDEFSRKLSTTTLLEFAYKEKGSKQLILITPHEIGYERQYVAIIMKFLLVYIMSFSLEYLYVSYRISLHPYTPHTPGLSMNEFT